MSWAAAVLATAFAASSGASINLDYDAPSLCPPVEHFQRELAARLGYDPVREPSTQGVKLAAREIDGGLVVTLKVGDAKERAFPGRADECAALVDGAAIALAIALDPVAMVKPRRPAAVTPPQAPVVVTEAPASAPPLEAALLAGVRSSVALLPQVSFGPAAQLRLRVHSFSIALEGDASFAVPLRAFSGTVAASVVRGGAQLCTHASFAGLCLRGTGGALAISGSGFADARTQWLPVATLGPAFTAEWSPSRRLLLQAAAGMELNLFRHSITVGAENVWQASLFTGFLTLGAGWQFL